MKHLFLILMILFISSSFSSAQENKPPEKNVEDDFPPDTEVVVNLYDNSVGVV